MEGKNIPSTSQNIPNSPKVNESSFLYQLPLGEDLFKPLIQSFFQANVLVCPSPGTSTLLSESNLTLTNLLCPFSTFDKVFVKSISNSYELSRWKIRFISIDDLFSSNTFESFIKALINQYDNQYSKNPFLEQNRYSYTKTFQVFRDEFLRNYIDVLDCSTIKHPIGVIFSITSNESLDELARLENSVSRIFSQFNGDPEIYKYYLVFQDASSHSNGLNLLEEVKKRYGNLNCRIVQINSRQENENKAPDIWTPNLPKQEQYIRKMNNIHTPKEKKSSQFMEFKSSNENNEERLGENFSLRDIQELESLVDNFVRNGILSTIQSKMDIINTTVSAKYGGRIRSIFKNLGFGNQKKKSEEDFSSDSVEMQVIRLADYMFLLRDYHSALQNYSKIKDDVKGNKKTYATINEFIGLSSFLHSFNTKEADAYLVAAYDSYVECGLNKYAIRVALIRGLLFESNKFYSYAADCYINAAKILDSDIFRAILYEQAALGYLYSGNKRKSSLFFMSSGYNYKNLNALNSSYRCHESSIYISGPVSENWNSRRTFNLELARLEESRNNYFGALKYFNKCLSQPTSGILQLDQRALFQEYHNIAKKYQEQLSINGTNSEPLFFSDLKIPQINTNRARLLLNTYGEGKLMESHDEIWDEMESHLTKLTQKTISFKRHEKNYSHIAEINSSFKFEFFAVNNFSINLNLTSIIPLFTFKLLETDEILDNQSENLKNIVEFQNVSLTILPKSIITIALTLTCHQKGLLTITGVKWTLDDFVSGEANIQLKGKRLNLTKEQKRSVQYQDNQSLSVNIIDPYPKISVEYDDIPKTILNGQILKRKIIIRNIGNVSVKDICIKNNFPQLMLFSSSDTNFSIKSEIKEKDITQISKDKFNIQEESVFFPNLGEKGELSPSESIEIFVFLRGLSLGTYDLRFLVLYGPVNKNPHVSYRLSRFQTHVTVEQSLFIHAYTNPSSTDISNSLMTVTVTNASSSIIELEQISSIGKSWIFSPLNDFTNSILNPNESVILHFNLNDLKEKIQLKQSTIPLSENKKIGYDLSSSISWELIKKNILYSSKMPNLISNYINNIISLFLYWRIENNDIIGLLDIPHFNVLQGSTTYPLRVIASYDQNPIYNAAFGCFILPFSLEIHRDITDSSNSKTYTLEMLNDGDATDYLWIGTSKVSIEIEPGQTVTKISQANFFKPGVYNLNRFRIVSNDKIVFDFKNHQFLCHVKSK